MLVLLLLIQPNRYSRNYHIIDRRFDKKYSEKVFSYTAAVHGDKSIDGTRALSVKFILLKKDWESKLIIILSIDLI